jgi:hypothetical protein
LEFSIVVRMMVVVRMWWWLRWVVAVLYRLDNVPYDDADERNEQ